MASMVARIENRGPDTRGSLKTGKAMLGHTRLSIIDLDPRANQPMQDESGRYTLIFNGEIYNFKNLRTELSQNRNVEFHTESDTEVLLRGLIHYGSDILSRLNGFFAFAFYDSHNDSLLLARDRFGIKPLYYSFRNKRMAFASSLTSLMAALDSKKIDLNSLATYLQLSYIPAPATILEGVYKLEPGHLIKIEKGELTRKCYYRLPETTGNETLLTEADAAKKFRSLLEDAVRDRLLADVPVGTFLSGGIDSSVITFLAREARPDIPVFSIGFPDQPFFDESDRAAAMARHLNVNHHIIALRENEIDNRLESILNAIDEPFADSSAVLVNILSEKARKEVKVVLSGDGADEIMGGYIKHRALLQSLDRSVTNALLRNTSGMWSLVPESRNSKTLNYLRKVKRYSAGLTQPFAERYKSWAGFTASTTVDRLLRSPSKSLVPDHGLIETDFNSVLKADVNLVLPNDMLHKVDLMSMAHGLEARVPFLDHRLVEFLFSLPAHYKLNRTTGKRILRRAFANDFPPGFFDSPKRGFEAPLSHWLRGPLSAISKHYFSKSFVDTQGLFNYEELKNIEKKALSKSPGDAPHTIWALIVFQNWYDRHFQNGNH